jgi:hypothetical protein
MVARQPIGPVRRRLVRDTNVLPTKLVGRGNGNRASAIAPNKAGWARKWKPDFRNRARATSPDDGWAATSWTSPAMMSPAVIRRPALGYPADSITRHKAANVPNDLPERPAWHRSRH